MATLNASNQVAGEGGWSSEERIDGNEAGGGQGLSSEGWRGDRWRVEALRALQTRRVRVAGAVACAVAIGLVVASLMTSDDDESGLSTADVPLIEADDAPIKVRPEDPGGMRVAHRDKLVYQRLTEDGVPPPVERLLPEPEEPLPPPERPEAGTDGAAQNGALAEVGAGDDGTSSGQGTGEPGVAADASALSPEPPPGELSAAAQDALALLMPSSSAQTEAAREQTAAPGAGTYQVQLASVRSREEAQSEWARLRRRHPDLLSGLRPAVSRAEVEARGTYYRLRAGPVGGRDQARQICKALAGVNVDCMVVRSGG